MPSEVEARWHEQFKDAPRLRSGRTTIFTQQASISVTVNGEQRRIAAGASIVAMLRELGIDPARVAVERNLAIVPRSTLADIEVEDGDQYEIVHFVGGG